jgi:hypothetical protein
MSRVGGEQPQNGMMVDGRDDPPGLRIDGTIEPLIPVDEAGR